MPTNTDDSINERLGYSSVNLNDINKWEAP